MPDENNISIFPLAGWDIGPVPDYDIIVMKFNYLSSPIQPLNEAHETKLFGITPDQARDLISALHRHIQTIEQSEIEFSSEERH